jgi:hypothetical protein
MFRNNLSVPSWRFKKSNAALSGSSVPTFWGQIIDPIFKGQEIQFLDSWRWDQYVVPKRRYRTTTQRYSLSQKSTDLISNLAEAWNLAIVLVNKTASNLQTLLIYLLKQQIAIYRYDVFPLCSSVAISSRQWKGGVHFPWCSSLSVRKYCRSYSHTTE